MAVPYQKDGSCQTQDLFSRSKFAVVPILANGQSAVHEKEAIRMQRTNLIENVTIPEGEAQKRNTEIDPKEYPKDADDGIILLGIEISCVVEARHEYEGGDEEATKVPVYIDITSSNVALPIE